MQNEQLYDQSEWCAGAAVPPPMASGYADMAYAQQGSTPPWLQGQNASTIWSPAGKARMSPGGLSPAHVYSDASAHLPHGAPPDAVGFQPWQIVEEKISACISTCMAALGQHDWAVRHSLAMHQNRPAHCSSAAHAVTMAQAGMLHILLGRCLSGLLHMLDLFRRMLPPACMSGLSRNSGRCSLGLTMTHDQVYRADWTNCAFADQAGSREVCGACTSQWLKECRLRQQLPTPGRLARQPGAP